MKLVKGPKNDKNKKLPIPEDPKNKNTNGLSSSCQPNE